MVQKIQTAITIIINTSVNPREPTAAALVLCEGFNEVGEVDFVDVDEDETVVKDEEVIGASVREGVD